MGEKMQLEYILSQHQAECKLFNQMSNFENDSSVPMSLPMAVKSEPVVVQAIETFELNPNLSTAVVAPRSSTGGLKPKRPLTLTISQSDAKNTLSEDHRPCPLHHQDQDHRSPREEVL